MGEIPMLIVVMAIFAQWVKSDMREARRKDRAADRDNDAESGEVQRVLEGAEQERTTLNSASGVNTPARAAIGGQRSLPAGVALRTLWN
jgi:hypothetical protein